MKQYIDITTNEINEEFKSMTFVNIHEILQSIYTGIKP